MCMSATKARLLQPAGPNKDELCSLECHALLINKKQCPLLAVHLRSCCAFEVFKVSYKDQRPRLKNAGCPPVLELSGGAGVLQCAGF